MNMTKKIFAVIVSAFLIAPVFCDDAVVTYVKGKVEKAQGNGWVSLKAGDKVTQSDVINTGFQSEAKIKYQDSVMYLGAVTRITLSQLSSSQEKNGRKDDVNVYLNTGAVRSKVNHTSNNRVNYTVRSAVAVASVKGTVTTSRSDGQVSCEEGAVVVSPNTAVIAEDGTEVQEEAAAEEETKVSSVTDEKGTAASAANTIVDKAPAGAVVVGKNMSVKVSGSSPVAAAPVVAAQKTAGQIVSKVATAAAKEASSSGAVSVEATTTAAVSSAPVNNGTLAVTVIIQ